MDSDRLSALGRLSLCTSRSHQSNNADADGQQRVSENFTSRGQTNRSCPGGGNIGGTIDPLPFAVFIS